MKKKESKNAIKNECMSSSSKRSFITEALLCFYFGAVGAHRFYAGKKITGMSQALVFLLLNSLLLLFGIRRIRLNIIGLLLIFLLLLILWVLTDFIFVVIERFKDEDGLIIRAEDRAQKEDLASICFASLALILSVAGVMADEFGLCMTLELLGVLFAIVPLFYGITGVVIKNQRGLKLAGFLISIAVLLFSSIFFVIRIGDGI